MDTWWAKVIKKIINNNITDHKVLNGSGLFIFSSKYKAKKAKYFRKLAPLQEDHYIL